MLETINVLSELERYGVDYKWAGDNEVLVVCPFHDDDRPSCAVNIEKRVFCCQSAECRRSGDVLTLFAGALKTTREVVWVDVSKRYNISQDKIIDVALVEKWHAGIDEAKPLINELSKRGVTRELIRKYRLGVHDGRITIPIPNEHGSIVNVRRYLPGAPDKSKMLNFKGFSKIRLFPIDQLNYEEIVITGGEMKAIVAAAQLNPHGIGAISTTGGEGKWEPSFTAKFVGKKVYVCMDVDAAGAKAARQICLQVCKHAAWTGVITLPLDVDKYPTGDINDFVGVEKGDMLSVLPTAVEFVAASKIVLTENDPIELDLSDAINADASGTRVKVQGVVSAVDTAPYIIPMTVQYICDKAQDECAGCDLFSIENDVVSLHPESPALLEMIGTSRNNQRAALMRGLGVPPTCRAVNFEPTSFYNVEDARITPRLEITNKSTDRIIQPAVCIGPRLELNESYEFIGRAYPHPATQQSTLLISKYTPTRDALALYADTGPELDLSVFQPPMLTEEGVRDKLHSIYEDLESNVTKIFYRRELHLVLDLIYHTALLLPFDGKIVKGWGEGLIVGDSGQGKSEAATNLMKFYELGELVECKNASVAGLLGGCQQMGSRWFVSWGFIPTHDRRLIILEELKGASVELIGKLTNMRSSGIAEIPKIEKRRTNARTRLIALSNPRSDRNVGTYNYGVDVVRELIGSPEDVRRFDIALVLSKDDSDPAAIEAARTKIIDHTYTKDLCKSLVLWAWTRSEKDVIIDTDAYSCIMDATTDMCSQFDDSIPIVDRGTMRLKIARLATAVAARTFSTEDGIHLIVRDYHVNFLTSFLKKMYTGNAMGYGRYSDDRRTVNTVSGPDDVVKRINNLPFPREFIQHILAANSIDAQDIQDWSSWDRREAADLLSFFVRRHALKRSGRKYYKTPTFIELLRGTLSNGAITERPSFIEEPLDNKEMF